MRRYAQRTHKGTPSAERTAVSAGFATEIRNSLVHPDHSTRGKVSAANFESWKVGLWCLELAILRICGFHGRYSNRLRERMVGETEVVPWDAD